MDIYIEKSIAITLIATCPTFSASFTHYSWLLINVTKRDQVIPFSISNFILMLFVITTLSVQILA